MKFMIKNKLNWVLIAAMAVVSPMFAQQEQMYTHYDFNSLAMNPAYAGSKRTLVASALNRTQWATYPGAPNYQSLAVHSPVSQAPAFRDFAVGLNLQTGKIGKFAVASPFAETEFAANIAYHKEIARNLRLAVGLRVGAFNYSAELSKLQLQNPGDVTFNNNDYSITAPMTGFGVYLYSDKYFAAISAPRMVFINERTAPSGVNLDYVSEMHYYAIAGAVFEINDDVKLKPTTQVKFVNGAPMQADLNLHLFYKDFGSIGGFFRTGGDIGFMTMVKLNPSFNVLYSFDSKTSPLNEYVRGSHEIGIQYMISPKENSRVKVPRYF
jgi:type IX secretion system PorP/SprF family membrane protein